MGSPQVSETSMHKQGMGLVEGLQLSRAAAGGLASWHENDVRVEAKSYS